MTRALGERKVQIVIDDTWHFWERASGQQGEHKPSRMDVTTEAGALFGSSPRRKDKELLLDTPPSTLASAPVWIMQHATQKNTTPTQLTGRTSIGARSPLPSPYFLSLYRRVVRLAQRCRSLLRSWPLAGVAQFADTLRRVPAFGGGNVNRTPLVDLFLSFTAGCHSAREHCRQQEVPVARIGTYTSTLYSGENQAPRTGRRERGWGHEQERGREREWKREQERRRECIREWERESRGGRGGRVEYVREGVTHSTIWAVRAKSIGRETWCPSELLAS